MSGEIYSVRPLVAFLMPWMSLLGIILFRNNRNLKRAFHVGGSVLAFAVVLSLLPDILDGKNLGINIIQGIEHINIHFTVDALGYYYGMVLTFIWMLATIFSLGYIEHGENRFYGFMALCDSFILGCAFSQNMFTYFIFYELMTFAAYPLIIHEETPEARRAGLKYLIYATSGGAVIFFAIAAQYFWGGGNLSIVSGGILSLKTASRTVLTFIFFAYLAGFGVKAAIIPLHGWVPDAHPAAPSPASAVLSGVILKAGAFGITRVVLNVFGLALFKELNLSIYLAMIASITIVVSSIFAVAQDNLKRRLAYSSIGQVSYILLGLSLASYHGVLGGMMHIAHHALMKGCLFLCAGIILVRTGKRNVSEMKGIGYRLPVTMVCFAIAALAMMGTPPTVGFISKWLLGIGALEAGNPMFIGILLVSALLNAVYFLPVIYTAFFEHPEGVKHPVFHPGAEASRAMIVPVVILAALVVVSGALVDVPGFPYSEVSKALQGFFH
ncbi:MAG: proton-conducting transporter membrane subunit [Chloroflexota bacterium]